MMDILRDLKNKIGRLPGLDDSRKRIVFALVAIGALGVALFSSIANIRPEAGVEASGGSFALSDVRHQDPFADLKLEAKSVYVLDIQTGEVLFERNADAILPLASVTKVMMAMTASDLIPKHTVVRIDPSFLAEEGDSGLYADEDWRLKDLLDYSLVVSSNDGASAIAAVAGSIATGAATPDIGRQQFVSEMNRKAAEIGLMHTSFRNATGLDTNSFQNGGYGTARDMAQMFAYAIREYPSILEATKYPTINVRSLSSIPHTGRNTNESMRDIPGIIASKTGFTDLSGGNLVVVFDAGLNRPIAISVLGSTYDGRFSDMKKLALATLDYLSGGRAKDIDAETARVMPL